MGNKYKELMDMVEDLKLCCETDGCYTEYYDTKDNHYITDVCPYLEVKNDDYEYATCRIGDPTSW